MYHVLKCKTVEQALITTGLRVMKDTSEFGATVLVLYNPENRVVCPNFVIYKIILFAGAK